MLILKRGLMIWGAITLLGAIAFYASLAYQLNSRTTANVESDDQDVRYVLEWFGLNADIEADVVHSFHPTGSWSGDYTKAFAMRIADIEESALIQKGGVSRGDKLTPIIRNAVEFVSDFTDETQVPWLPKREKVFSSKYYVYPVRVVFQGEYPDSVHIMFIRPADKMVFFIAVKI